MTAGQSARRKPEETGLTDHVHDGQGTDCPECGIEPITVKFSITHWYIGEVTAGQLADVAERPLADLSGPVDEDIDSDLGRLLRGLAASGAAASGSGDLEIDEAYPSRLDRRDPLGQLAGQIYAVHAWITGQAAAGQLAVRRDRQVLRSAVTRLEGLIAGYMIAAAEPGTAPPVQETALAYATVDDYAQAAFGITLRDLDTAVGNMKEPA